MKWSPTAKERPDGKRSGPYSVRMRCTLVFDKDALDLIEGPIDLDRGGVVQDWHGLLLPSLGDDLGVAAGRLVPGRPAASDPVARAAEDSGFLENRVRSRPWPTSIPMKTVLTLTPVSNVTSAMRRSTS